MGQDHALDAAQDGLSATGPISAFRAGWREPCEADYRPGDILAARLVSEVGEPVAVASHRELLSTAVDCGARQIERFATSRTLVARAEQKRQLGEPGGSGGNGELHDSGGGGAVRRAGRGRFEPSATRRTSICLTISNGRATPRARFA